MFVEWTITPLCRPHEVRPGGELMSDKNAIRIYRISPRKIGFQLRCKTRIVHVGLSEHEAVALINALKEAIAEGHAP